MGGARGELFPAFSGLEHALLQIKAAAAGLLTELWDGSGKSLAGLRFLPLIPQILRLSLQSSYKNETLML